MFCASVVTAAGLLLLPSWKSEPRSRLGALRWKRLYGPLPPCCPPLCHWPSARAAVEGPTAGAQGRLAHMAVFFSLELLAGSPSKTSSTIPTTPAPSPASYATHFSPPHSFPPRRVLRGARALAGCSEQCVLCFPPRGKCREPAWGRLGAWRSETKAEPSKVRNKAILSGTRASEAPSSRPTYLVTTVFWSILALRSSFCCWRTWIFSSRIMFFSAYKRCSVKSSAARPWGRRQTSALGFRALEDYLKQCFSNCTLQCIGYKTRLEGCDQHCFFKQMKTE